MPPPPRERCQSCNAVLDRPGFEISITDCAECGADICELCHADHDATAPCLCRYCGRNTFTNERLAT